MASVHTLIVQVGPAGVSTFPTNVVGGLLGLQRAGPSAPLDEVKRHSLVGSHYIVESIGCQVMIFTIVAEGGPDEVAALRS